jgi:hypothetical protein
MKAAKLETKGTVWRQTRQIGDKRDKLETNGDKLETF